MKNKKLNVSDEKPFVIDWTLPPPWVQIKPFLAFCETMKNGIHKEEVASFMKKMRLD